MSMVRRCLGCSATYPADEPACPNCGSYAGEVEDFNSEKDELKPEAKPKPKRKT